MILMCLIINKPWINANWILINALKNAIKWEESAEDLKSAKKRVQETKKIVIVRLIHRNNIRKKITKSNY